LILTKIVSDINGVVPILPTPFNNDESIDESGYENILAFAKAAECSSVCVPAFGSEFYKLFGEERSRILDIVFKYSKGLNVIVQCNHNTPKFVQTLIKDAESRGASAINTALPRTMVVSENQLFKYASIVCSSTKLPVIIQDYNPGGAVVGLDFVKKLSDEFDNFKFIKYEVPGIGSLIKDILNATQEKVKVFSGWGGSFMLEQIPAGIAGIMPGLPLVDYFIMIWKHAHLGNVKDALKMFAAISAYLTFSLQNLEMFHHAEKRLAVRRGIIKVAVVRSVSITLDDFQEKYLESLLDQICDTIEQYGLKIKLNQN
jgi:2-keto-3-deoxy-L-arabinonate dehydratase